MEANRPHDREKIALRRMRLEQEKEYLKHIISMEKDSMERTAARLRLVMKIISISFSICCFIFFMALLFPLLAIILEVFNIQ